MSNSIEQDPIKPKNTPDLGLSQAYRLYGFLNPSGKKPIVSLDELEGLNRLPVIGAEFHFTDEPTGIHEKLFALNMAQYHSGSSIPLSKRDSERDEDILEVRMNPSYYPITIANWELMRKIIPLDNVSFFLSMTPIPKDDRQLEDLKSLANIVLASQYEIFPDKRIPRLVGIVADVAVGVAVGVADVIGVPSLGEHYFGQTQKLENGKYELPNVLRDVNGKVPQTSRDSYQLNLYSGFGKVFSEQAYYLSMAYLAPEILETIRKNLGVVNIKKASKMHPKDISHIITTINAQILKNPVSAKATKVGQDIKNQFQISP